MGTKIWLGGAQVVRQLNTVTPANVNIGNTFTLTRNGKSLTFTATAATVANVTAGLAALVAAATEPEFQEMTPADNTTNLLLTGPDDGAPISQTSSATGGTATLTTANTTAGSGPNYWSTAANWSPSGVPAASDDVVIDRTSNVDILYGLNQTGTLLNSLTRDGHTGRIGLPTRNGRGYAEDRTTYLSISATTVNVGPGGSFRLDTGTNQTTVNVTDTGPSTEPGLEAFLWKGNQSSNVVNVDAGSVGIAVLAGELAPGFNTLRAGGGTSGTQAQVRVGASVSPSTVNQAGGEVILGSGATTVKKTGGTLTVQGGAVTTLNEDGGVTYWNTNGTCTTATVSEGGKIDLTRDNRPRTFTNLTLHAGAAWLDSFGTVTYTNGIVLYRCSVTDLKEFDIGTHKTLTVAAGP